MNAGRPLIHRKLLIPLWIFLFSLFALNGSSQSAYFKPISLSNDEKQSSFNCIFQDNSGLIWIGSGSGLYTFDGRAFQKLEMPDNIRSAGTTAIFEDSENKLWIGQDDGSVFQYDSYETFDPILSPQAGKSGRITGFVEDKNGNLWIATYGAGLHLKNDTGIIVLDTDSGLSDNYIYSIIETENGHIWVGTDNGINTFNPDQPLNIAEVLSLEEGLPDFIVQSLTIDADGNIWAGTYEKGVCVYSPEERAFHVPEGLSNWEYGSVRDFVILNDRAWIATAEKGLLEYRFSNQSVKFYDQCNGNNLARVKSMLSDREGNIWLLSNNEICLSFGNKLEFLSQHNESLINNVHALTVDKQDKIWFANDNGLFSFDPHEKINEKKLIRYPLNIDLSSQKIMSLYRDDYGYLWIGTFGQGLLRIHPETDVQRAITEKDGLANGNILSIAGNASEIWFGTLGGASKCIFDERLKDPSYIPEFLNFGQKEGLVNSYIYQVYLSDDGTPHFATDGNGTLIYVDGTFRRISKRDNSSREVVYSVASDAQGNTWMNIANDGLYQYDGQLNRRVSNGIDQERFSFSGILNNRNEMILAYDNGIDVLNIDTETLRHFEENAGITNINPDLNTLAMDSENNVWIGTAKGIIKYQAQDGDLWENPRTVLHDVALFLHGIDHRTENNFSHEENHLSFSYTGLWYQYPQKIEYLIKLEGHDLGWIKTLNNQAIYSDLKPGNYTFRVKAGIYNNYAGSNEATYSFTIAKPFYTTIGFYLIVILLAGIALAIIMNIRVKQVRKKEEAIQEKIQFQFDNLKSQINPHFLFNSFSTLIALIESDSNSAVSYVEELSTLFRNILEYKDRELISLDKEIKIAENYIKLQKKRFGNNLVVNIDKKDSFSGINIPPLTLQLLIENAIKHNVVSGEGPLTISIFIKKDENRIFVENNLQPKMDAVSSTGIGINNIMSRYKLLTDTRVEINNTGSSFIVGLPFIR